MDYDFIVQFSSTDNSFNTSISTSQDNFNTTVNETSQIFFSSIDEGSVNIRVSLEDSLREFTPLFDTWIGSGGGIPYEGPYNFIPSVYNIQTGYTAGKTMTQNITVQKIPQYEVSNPQGGLTLTIGEL